jgi:uncharacterized protein
MNKTLENNTLDIIHSCFKSYPIAHSYYLTHCNKVWEKALEIIRLNPDKLFDKAKVYQMSMLHDIGICMVDAPEIGCYGKHPYIHHGYLGREILEKESLADIARVCECHIGVGLNREEAVALGLPDRDMMPVSMEEKLICLADKFYSKSPEYLEKEKSIQHIQDSIAKYGAHKAQQLTTLLKFFKLI